MAFRDEIDAIDDRIDLKVAPTFVEGTVVSVMPKYVRLRVTGSSRSIKAYYSSAAPPEVNERAMATLSAHQNKYVLVTSYPGQGSAAGAGKRKPEDFALAPPNNLAAVAMPGAIVVQWDDPVAQVLAYEVQTNTSGVDAGATTYVVTRGMVSIPTATALYARVRSVTTDFRYSSWSDWVSASPNPFTATFADLTDVNVSGVTDGDVPVWDAALSLWVPGSGGGGGSFSGDAFDVPYTPTTSGDWSSVPTDAGMALDTLAAAGSGSAPAYPKRATLWHDESTVITGNAIATDTSGSGRYTTRAYQNAPAINDEFTNGMYLEAGTYTLSVLGQSNTNCGQVTWYIDGVSAVSAQDWYAASGAFATKTASVTVSTDGWHVLKGIVAGKHASSSNYFLVLVKMWFKQASD